MLQENVLVSDTTLESLANEIGPEGLEDYETFPWWTIFCSLPAPFEGTAAACTGHAKKQIRTRVLALAPCVAVAMENPGFIKPKQVAATLEHRQFPDIQEHANPKLHALVVGERPVPHILNNPVHFNACPKHLLALRDPVDEWEQELANTREIGMIL